MIIGHQKIVVGLRKKIKDGSHSQAYIFSGPEGVGKFLVAQNFARGIIAGKDFAELSEKETDQADLDLLLVRPEREEKKGVIKEKEITVDQVKGKQAELATFPYSGKFKVLIVDESDRMNLRAQNAMLKTIEEPNSTAVIILVTSRLEKLLPTVRSRCQIINFNLVDPQAMADHFSGQGQTVSREAIDYSMGRPGIMLEIAGDPEKVGWYRESEKMMETVMSGSLNEKMKMADGLSKNIPDALDHLHFWLWLLQKSGQTPDLLRAGNIKEAEERLKNTNANARLLLEDVFLNLQ